MFQSRSFFFLLGLLLGIFGGVLAILWTSNELQLKDVEVREHQTEAVLLEREVRRLEGRLGVLEGELARARDRASVNVPVNPLPRD